MLAAPFDSAEVDKFHAAFARKGRTGLGFTAQSNNTSTSSAACQTQAERELLSSSTSSAFSASAYLHKFGWQPGTGLGKRADGIVSHVKAARRDGQAGIGAGLAATAVARSFEMVFNNAARNFNVVIHADSSDDDDQPARQQTEDETKEEAQDESAAENVDDERKTNEGRKSKKRKQREERSEERKQLSSDDESPTSTTPPPAATAAIRPAMIAFKTASSTSTSAPATTAAVAPDSLLSFDSTRSHMYHDRCRGKLARLMAQESDGQHIVEAVKRKRREGAGARDESKETTGQAGEKEWDMARAAEAEEGERSKRKAERKERKRREREAVQQAELERKVQPPTKESLDADAEAERKERRKDRKAAQRSLQGQ